MEEHDEAQDQAGEGRRGAVQDLDGPGLVTASGAATGDPDVTDPDAALLEGRDLPSTRAPLSRERVVAAAVDLIDARSLDALTMRALATTLGVEAMSLYRYVPSRDDLLEAVVDRIAEQLKADPDVVMAPTHGWQDFLQRLAHGVRRVAIAHPKVFPLVASRPPQAPWLRPPLRSLEVVEAFIAGLRGQGFSREQVAAAYRAFTSFLLGHLLLEVAQAGADITAEGVHDSALSQAATQPSDEAPRAQEPLAPYPAIADVQTYLAQDHAAAEFEEALEDLIDRVSLMLQP